jgi:ribonuclease D
MRPLSPDMLAYAALDTHYLAELAVKLRDDLTALGRWEWALEEFARLEAIRFREADPEEEGWRRLKTLGTLDRRGLAVVREVYIWRDGLARAADRPPFKILGNDAILDLAKEKPQNDREFSKVKALSHYHRGRYGRDLLAMVQKALAIPEEVLPEKSERPAWNRDRELENRINKLKRVRDAKAKELAIDPGLLAPRHVLSAIASGRTLDVPAMREWQKRVVGDALLAALG